MHIPPFRSYKASDEVPSSNTDAALNTPLDSAWSGVLIVFAGATALSVKSRRLHMLQNIGERISSKIHFNNCEKIAETVAQIGHDEFTLEKSEEGAIRNYFYGGMLIAGSGAMMMTGSVLKHNVIYKAGRTGAVVSSSLVALNALYHKYSS